MRVLAGPVRALAPAPVRAQVPAGRRGRGPFHPGGPRTGILAEDKRKHQTQLQRVEKMLEETAASKNLTVQEREQLAQQLEDLRKETRTKEQQLAHEKKQLEEQFTKQDHRRREEGPRGVGAPLP